MSLEQMEEETPVGLIRFTTETDEKAIAWWNNAELDTLSSWNYYYGADVRDQDFYPVYPSFTKTIRLLGQYGVSVKDEALSDKIVSVTVMRQIQILTRRLRLRIRKRSKPLAISHAMSGCSTMISCMRGMI